MGTIDLTSERLILCEGSTDKTFFLELIQARGLQDFNVNFPAGVNDNTGGIHKFERFLKGITVFPTFNILKGILVVADNDNSPIDNFNLVKNQIIDAGYGTVNNELEFVTSPNNYPPIAIMMLPLNQQIGTLETVCKVSAYTKWNNLIPTLTNYFNASDALNWDVGHQDKMLIQCLIAATCEPNPNATIATLYREQPQFHLPLNHACFDDIAQFLTDWDNLLP